MKPYFTDSTGTIQIFLGDCREILPSLKADVVVTDPPYGIRYASNHTAPTTTARWMNSEIAGDADTGARDFVLLQFNEWACFGSYDAPAPGLSEDVLIWDKGPASGMGDLAWPWKRSWELVFVRGCGWSGSRDEGVLKGHHIVTRASMGRVHPNEKPVSLLRYLIGKHSGEIILDPFMGSGTTLRAAKDLGRRAIGIEIEERYAEIAARRLQQEVLPFGHEEQGARVQVSVLEEVPRQGEAVRGEAVRDLFTSIPKDVR